MSYLRPLILLSIIAVPVRASEEGHETGKLPASVVAHDPESGFKLSEAAVKRLGIRFEELKGAGPWNVRRSSLVRIKRSIGVYRQVDGFLTFVVIEAVGAGARARIRSDDLRSGDRIAVEGGAFLRVIDLDLSGGGGDSCG